MTTWDDKGGKIKEVLVEKLRSIPGIVGPYVKLRLHEAFVS